MQMLIFQFWEVDGVLIWGKFILFMDHLHQSTVIIMLSIYIIMKFGIMHQGRNLSFLIEEILES